MEIILRRWVRGEDINTIALSIRSSPANVAKYIQKARRLGDPRARPQDQMVLGEPPKSAFVRRIKLGLKFPVTKQELVEIARKATVKAKKCSTGVAFGAYPLKAVE